jgi:hypothetical protein
MYPTRKCNCWLLVALLATVATSVAACAGELDDPARFAECRAGQAEELVAQRCTTIGCHGANQPAAGLDLASSGLGARLVGVASPSDECGGRLYISTTDDRHLFLDKLGKPPCGARMPFAQAALSGADIECIRRWVDDTRAATP